MRTALIIVFAIGVLAFIAAGLFIGNVTGDTLWRVGVALMLTVVAWTQLLPLAKRDKP